MSSNNTASARQPAAASSRALAARAAVAALRARSTDSPSVIAATTAALGSSSRAAAVLAASSSTGSPTDTDGRHAINAVRRDQVEQAKTLAAEVAVSESLWARFRTIEHAIASCSATVSRSMDADSVPFTLAEAMALQENLASLSSAVGSDSSIAWRKDLQDACKIAQLDALMLQALVEFYLRNYCACSQTLLKLLLADDKRLEGWLLRCRCFLALECTGGAYIAHLHVKKVLNIMGMVAEHVSDKSASQCADMCVNPDSSGCRSPVIDCLHAEYPGCTSCKNEGHRASGGVLHVDPAGLAVLQRSAVAEDLQLVSEAKALQTHSGEKEHVHGHGETCSHAHDDGHHHGHHHHVDKAASCCKHTPLLARLEALQEGVLHEMLRYSHQAFNDRVHAGINALLGSASDVAFTRMADEAALLFSEGMFESAAEKHINILIATCIQAGICQSTPAHSVSDALLLLDRRRDAPEWSTDRPLVQQERIVRAALNIAACQLKLHHRWKAAVLASSIAMRALDTSSDSCRVAPLQHLKWKCKALFRRATAAMEVREYDMALADTADLAAMLAQLEQQVLKVVLGTAEGESKLTSDEIAQARKFLPSMLKETKAAQRRLKLLMSCEGLLAA